MAERYPGGVISKTPPVVTGPATSGPLAGEGGSASGMWTLDTVLEYEKAGAWPKPVLPRELYAWGRNNHGQIGDNTLVNRSSPVQVGALTTWSQVSAAASVTAIKTDNTLWTWGRNNDGQLGQNDVVSRSSPTQVGVLTNWSKVSRTLAIKTDGTLWSWGSNGSGQVGDGTTAPR
jgi:alpha-tubulin suppressor-like RCC1 family protein